MLTLTDQQRTPENLYTVFTLFFFTSNQATASQVYCNNGEKGPLPMPDWKTKLISMSIKQLKWSLSPSPQFFTPNLISDLTLSLTCDLTLHLSLDSTLNSKSDLIQVPPILCLALEV